jgi:spermidine synthase
MRIETGRACATAFLAAFAALFLQVLVHRMVSAKMLSDYAFLVISLTMLGFAAAGALLSYTQHTVLAHRETSLTLVSALFAVSALLSSIAFYATETAAPAFFTRPRFVSAFFGWIPFALAFAVPFACVAFMLGALLAAKDLDARRVYFFDLLGSALGALLVLPAIRALGVETSLLLLAGLIPLATSWLLAPRSRWARAAVYAAVAATLVVGVFRRQLLELQPAAGTPVAQARQAGVAGVEEYVRWDPLARIELSRISPPESSTSTYSSLIGDDRAFLSRFERMLTQNNYAYTYAVRYDGSPGSFTGVEQTLYAAAYEVRPEPPARVVVIGVGGGFDILTALHFRSSEVTGVEVNGTILRLLTRDYRDYFRPWVEDPRVRLVSDEGRHFLAQEQRSFDIIQLSGVDSYSGTPGAAHVFSENYLYTQQAFALYLSRLSPEGLVHMMRLEYTPPREMLRALVTAVGALREAGAARPADHIVTLTATRGNITSLLVKRAPFTAAELERLERWSARSPHFKMSAAPDRNTRLENAYQSFLSQETAPREQAFASAYPFDITPTDDDRPFFFRFSRWWHLFPSDPLVWVAVPVMEYSLILLSLAVGATALLVVWLPCDASRVTAGFPASAASSSSSPRSGSRSWPSKWLSCSGSASSSAIRAMRSRWCWPCCSWRAAWARGSRGEMGTFLPSGLERLKERAPSFVPWAWGVNGVASVVAPVISIGLGITFGNVLLLVAALPLYLLAGACLPPARVSP